MSRNNLNFDKFFQLCGAIQQPKFKEQMLADRPSFAEAAVLLSEKLGFTVSEGNLKSARHAAGFSWTPRRMSSTGQEEVASAMEHVKEGITAIQMSLANIRQRTETTGLLAYHLYTAVIRVYEKIGLRLPPEIGQLVNKLQGLAAPGSIVAAVPAAPAPSGMTPASP